MFLCLNSKFNGNERQQLASSSKFTLSPAPALLQWEGCCIMILNHLIFLENWLPFYINFIHSSDLQLIPILWYLVLKPTFWVYFSFFLSWLVNLCIADNVAMFSLQSRIVYDFTTLKKSENKHFYEFWISKVFKLSSTVVIRDEASQ